MRQRLWQGQPDAEIEKGDSGRPMQAFLHGAGAFQAAGNLMRGIDQDDMDQAGDQGVCQAIMTR